MRDALLVVCLLLTLEVEDGSAEKLWKRTPRSSIWSSMRGNAADINLSFIKELSRAINETRQLEQDFGPVVDTLKENVEDMKEGFVSQTMLMAQMKTSIHDMKDAIENLHKITSGGDRRYPTTKIPNSPSVTKTTHGDISGTKRGIIDLLVSKLPTDFENFMVPLRP